MIEGVTLKKFWKKLAWSLKICWTGVYSSYDEDGCIFPEGSISRQLGDARTPLVGTDPDNCPFFILWKKKGDLDWYHKAGQISHFDFKGVPILMYVNFIHTHTYTHYIKVVHTHYVNFTRTHTHAHS